MRPFTRRSPAEGDGCRGRALAGHLTADLLAAGNDKHLYVSYDPARYAAALRTASKAPAGAGEDLDAYTRRQALRDHHGLAETRILPGNLRYLKITGFEWVRDETGAVYDDAMRFLKGGEAAIVDIRGNGGGSSAAVKYLISHFLDPDTLDMTSLEASHEPVQSRTLEYLPAGRLKGKPLYVLIDGGVGSAAEAFAYDVQQFKLGELVGTRTAGAANNNKWVPIPPGFMLSVSYARPVHALSHTNWEGVGVAPSVEAPPAQALDVAEELALKRLAEAPDLTPALRAEYGWARVGVEARLHPVTLAPEPLKALAGHYGKIDVELREGALWMTRSDRPRWPRGARLSPLTADGVFAVEGMEALRVRLTGKALELMWEGDAGVEGFARE